jgi:hypothetical protein
LQGSRASQSEARPASQASSSQVLQFHKNFLHFHHDLLAKPASDTMLVAATGCTDAFWRPSTWYLNIPVELRQLPPKTGRVKKEKMEKILVRREKIHVKMEKIIVYSWQDWSCYLEAVSRGLSSGHKERALRCLFRSEM